MSLEDAQRAEDLLSSMEDRFKAIEAEHAKDEPTACYHIHVTEAWLDQKLDALVRWRMLGDMSGANELLAAAERMVTGLARRAAKAGWYGATDTDEED